MEKSCDCNKALHIWLNLKVSRVEVKGVLIIYNCMILIESIEKNNKFLIKI